MKRRYYKLYYICLSVIGLSMVALTMYIGSTHVSYGQQVAQLEHQAAELAQRKQQLTAEISHEQSLADISQLAEQAGYQPVSQVLRISSGQAVALAPTNN